MCGTEGFFSVEPRAFRCGTEGFWCVRERFVELRGFYCGPEGFFGLKRSGPFVWN